MIIMSLLLIFDIMVYDFILFPPTLSHGLNPGLGNAGHVSFPSAVTAAPTQVLLLLLLLLLLFVVDAIVVTGSADGKLHPVLSLRLVGFKY